MNSSWAVEELNFPVKSRNSVIETMSDSKWWLTGAEKTGYGDGSEKEFDEKAWKMLSEGFKEAQSVLDENRLLIQQVNENHQSKIHDNLVKNVALIQEITGNIAKVSSLYSNLSVNLATVVHQRQLKNKTHKQEHKES